MKPQEFIEIVLKKGIKNVIEKADEPFLAFSLISQGIEILGFIWYENINGFPVGYEKDRKKFSETIFKQGTRFLPKSSGKKYESKQLKDLLRNSMIHQLRPDENLILSDDVKSEKLHLKEIRENQFVLSLKPFFDDFCSACDALISELNEKFGRINNQRNYINSIGIEVDDIFIFASGGPFPVSSVDVFDTGSSDSNTFGH